MGVFAAQLSIPPEGEKASPWVDAEVPSKNRKRRATKHRNLVDKRPLLSMGVKVQGEPATQLIEPLQRVIASYRKTTEDLTAPSASDRMTLVR